MHSLSLLGELGSEDPTTILLVIIYPYMAHKSRDKENSLCFWVNDVENVIKFVISEVDLEIMHSLCKFLEAQAVVVILVHYSELPEQTKNTSYTSNTQYFLNFLKHILHNSLRLLWGWHLTHLNWRWFLWLLRQFWVLWLNVIRLLLLLLLRRLPFWLLQILKFS